MPFDDTATARLLDDKGKVKYDLTTGRGRLAYLADQLEARQPKDFNMGAWSHCAIGEGRKMEALVALGLPSDGIDSLATFFGISNEMSCHLFGPRSRSVDTEVAEIRDVIRTNRVR